MSINQKTHENLITTYGVPGQNKKRELRDYSQDKWRRENQGQVGPLKIERTFVCKESGKSSKLRASFQQGKGMPDPRNKARRLTPGSDKPMQIVFAYDKFGADAADETLDDVQEGKISVKSLEKHLCKDGEGDE